ncbi:MAG: restriction endonuclease subunit S [Crocinitomicaceae bacterium]|nr:restriction endonuclease subunit S [Crocinitomicaceae bacterium]
MKHNWETVKIGSIATQQKRIAKVDAKSDYNLIGIRSNNEGVFFRESKSGNDIFSNNLLQVNEGDFIYSRLSAPSGGFGVVTEEFDNCFVSNEFPVFEIDKNLSSSKFLFYYFSQKSVLYQLQSKGTGRTRFSEAEFCNQEILLPPLKVQNKILTTLEKVNSSIEEIKALRKEQEKDINNLLFSKYTDLIESSDWLPMKEVAPIIRRPVVLKDEALYPELGIRCFGKGTFHKPALTGTEVATKKIFQIKTGDLVFSNVFAWEGGIAVAKEEDNDRFGSHRFISCVADTETALVEFLCYHFLSPKGLEDINACSPGGAGRNKTLGLDKLMKISIPVPSIEFQREFVELLEKTNAIKEHHKQTEQELSELMPSLLDKAFKGEL